MGRYFGTDGIRGRAGEHLAPEVALRAAFGYAAVLPGKPSRRGGRSRIVIGHDPRLSSNMLVSAAQAGLFLGGCDVIDIGMVPTPLVALMVLNLRAEGGAMVTASHNPIYDNGIKFFGADGLKIDEKSEQRIEGFIDHPGLHTAAPPQGFGQLAACDAGSVYLAHLKRALGRSRGRGLEIVLDCAYGATSVLAPPAFEQAGHRVHVLHGKPDGSRINVSCGATNLAILCQAVRRRKADLGLAFDGDGDRVLAVDHLGKPVSGDIIIALLATRIGRYREEGAVVMTHMTNIGVELALRQRGIKLKRTEVGDTKVLAAMRRLKLHLGGEQSGHIIMSDKLPAGDGIQAGLALAALVAAADVPLAGLARAFPEYPQQLTNLEVKDKQAWQADAALRRQLARIKEGYRDVRFYLRPSGTENVVRVLTEAASAERCEQGNRAVCEALHAWGGV